MTVDQLRTKLRGFSGESEVYLADGRGGRLPLGDVHLEFPEQARAVGGIDTKKPIATLVFPEGGLEQSQAKVKFDAESSKIGP